ncbi:MAG: L,D-transpeptidase family protein [Acidobacteriota bacterium]
MGRFIFALVVVAGLGYGAWSLFGSGSDAPELSSQVSSETGVTASGAGAGAEAPEPNGPGKPAKKTEDEAERRRGLLRSAGEHLEAAEKAETRAGALAEKDKARRLVSEAMIASGGDEKLRERLDELNEDVLFSEEPLEGTSFLYTIQPGDRLWTLCYKTFPKEQKLHAEPGFLLWVNGLSDPSRIREGQILKVPREELTLYVRKSSRKLWVLLGGVYVREFDVGIGKNDKTPEGTFEIETKIEEPAWYFDGKRVPYGHPDNPLGTRWMGFKRTRKAAGYGIHGTDQPDTIGKALSEGCVRMLNEEVEELFTWVHRGTKVTIVR